MPEPTSRPSNPLSKINGLPGETAKATDSVPLAVGPFTVLPMRFGRYEVQKELGKGQMGAVYLAMDTELDRPVALKVARTSSSGSAKLLKRMEVEAKAAAIVDHPQICKVYDAGEIDGIRFIALQYVDGENLKQFLKRTGRRQKPKEAVRLVLQILRALEAAHEHGIIHRDLKPENVMLNKKFQPVIMDFGLARRTTGSSDAGLTQGMIVGTAAYMSPEQAVGKPEGIDHRSDLYAVGVMLFEMLTGEWPFTGGAMEVMGRKCVQEPPSPQSVNPDLPPQLSAVCHKMIAQRKENRFETCDAAVRAIEEIDLSGRGVVTPSVESTSLPFDFVHKETSKAEIKSESSDKSRTEQPIAFLPIWRSLNDRWGSVPVTLLLGSVLGCGLLFVGLLFGRWFRDKPVIPPPPSPPPFRVIDRRSLGNIQAIWRLEGDTLVQESLNDTCQLIFGDRQWKDYDFSCRVQIISGQGDIGLTVRHTENGFARFLRRNDHAEGVSFSSLENSKTSPNKLSPCDRLDNEQWCNLTVIVRGAHFQFLLDERPLFSFDDQNNLQGAVGLWTRRTTARFRDFRVTDTKGNVLFEGLPELPTPSPEWLPAFEKNQNPSNPQQAALIGDSVLLINGRDISNWWSTGLSSVWVDSDGSLRASGNELGSLVYKGQFNDFELTGDVYADSKGKGGICFRTSISEADSKSLIGGYKFQIAGSEGDAVSTGGLIQNTTQRVIDSTSSPIAENWNWTAIRVKVQGRHVEGWVKDYRTSKELCTFNRDVEADQLTGRKLALQFQHGDIRFRNLRVRHLQDAEPEQPPKSSPPPAPNDAWKPLFNGVDLSGWNIDGGQQNQWRVEGGEIVGRSGTWETRSYLLSDKSYRDFVLQFEFRIEGSNGDGGVTIRAIPGEKVPYGDDLICFDHPVLKLWNRSGENTVGKAYWIQSSDSVVKPLVDSDLSIEGWNKMEVTVKGDRCTAKLGQTSLVDLTLDRGVLNAFVPALARPDGKIGFQINTGTLRLRTILINDLTEPSNPSLKPSVFDKSTTDASFGTLVGQVLPGFTTTVPLERGEYDVRIVPEHFGRTGVLLTHPVSRETPCVLFGNFPIPTGKRTVLQLDVSHDKNGDWQLLVRANNELLFQKDVGPGTCINGWARHEIDLSKFAGTDVRIEIQNAATGWSNEFGYWSGAKLISTDDVVEKPADENDEWTPVFNGKDLKGWSSWAVSGLSNAVQPGKKDGWIVRDGEIVCDSTDSGWLRLDKKYRDCEFSFEFLLPNNSNSGLLLRYPGKGNPFPNDAFEIQLEDDPAATNPLHKTGALWEIVPPIKSAFLPNQWNQMVVRIERGDITIRLNQELIVNTNTKEHEKLRKFPGEGHFCLINYNGKSGRGKGCRFKNIQVRELASNAAGTDSGQKRQSKPQEAIPLDAKHFQLLGQYKTTGNAIEFYRGGNVKGQSTGASKKNYGLPIKVTFEVSASADACYDIFPCLFDQIQFAWGTFANKRTVLTMRM